MQDYFSGLMLYGDDFSLEQIREWYRDEEEAYANLGARDPGTYRYSYHALNKRHGFRHLPSRQFAHALGLGSAYGEEFKPIAPKIKRLTIIDPSSAYIAARVHGLPTQYIKPSIDGTLPFAEGSFDLVTCFGTLHHIPNVSHVVRELYRCLEPGGSALIREPIVSLGDWTRPRRGLTKRERGIPLHIFRQIIADAGLVVVKEKLCMFLLVARLRHVLGDQAYNRAAATWLDEVLANALAWNVNYHAVSVWQKFRPSAVFYVLTKNTLPPH